MDLDAVRIFVKVAELAGFTRAAEQLGMPKARVSTAVQQLEAQVGARLLHRTTRTVRLTQDGEQFLERAKELLTEAEELQSMFQAAPSALRGRLRIDMPIGLARRFVIPRLPEFFAAHPQLEVELSTTDRQVDPVLEGFDCVLRIGPLRDLGLVVRNLGTLRLTNFASPAYLREYGTPKTLEDLDRHLLIRYSPTLGGASPGWEYHDGERYRFREMRSIVTVNGTDAYEEACLAGLGLIQAPTLGHGRHPLVSQGRLVEVLPEWSGEPMRVSLLYPNRRNISKRVQAMLAWLMTLLKSELDPGPALQQTLGP
jgi:DNA-binding transcriptional LysR family regulator